MVVGWQCGDCERVGIDRVEEWFSCSAKRSGGESNGVHLRRGMGGAARDVGGVSEAGRRRTGSHEEGSSGRNHRWIWRIRGPKSPGRSTDARLVVFRYFNGESDEGAGS